MNGKMPDGRSTRQVATHTPGMDHVYMHLDLSISWSMRKATRQSKHQKIIHLGLPYYGYPETFGKLLRPITILLGCCIVRDGSRQQRFSEQIVDEMLEPYVVHSVMLLNFAALYVSHMKL